MIRQARPEEQAALQTLWLSSFADEEPCVALFVRSLCSYGCALVDAAEDALRAMLFLLPVRVQMSGASLPASYIYAAATRPDCRGQGRMTRLLAAAEERAASRGDVCVLLCPQTESLFAFYGARGYTGRIDRCSFLFSRPAERTSSMLPMRAISPEEASALRAAALQGRDAVQLPTAQLRLKAADTALAGGTLLGWHGGYAFVEPEGRQLHVRELLLGGAQKDILPALWEKYPKALTMRIDAVLDGDETFSAPGQWRPYGACRWLAAPPAGWKDARLFMNLMLE